MFVIFDTFLIFLFWVVLLFGYLYDRLTFLFIILTSFLFLALARCCFFRIINTFSWKK